MPILDPVHSVILNFRKRCKEKRKVPDDHDICFAEAPNGVPTFALAR